MYHNEAAARNDTDTRESRVIKLPIHITVVSELCMWSADLLDVLKLLWVIDRRA